MVANLCRWLSLQWRIFCCKIIFCCHSRATLRNHRSQQWLHNYWGGIQQNHDIFLNWRSESTLFCQSLAHISTEHHEHLEQSSNPLQFQSSWCRQVFWKDLQNIFIFLAWCRSWIFSQIIQCLLLERPKIWCSRQHQQKWFSFCIVWRIQLVHRGMVDQGRLKQLTWWDSLPRAIIFHIKKNSAHCYLHTQHRISHLIARTDQI